MSNLSIGLISSKDQESKMLVTLLQEQGIDVNYHLTSAEISTEHIESTRVSVWLLSVDDEHWHDNIDTLLDESDASIYFNEPGSLLKEEHPEYWCRNLVSRLYEVSGLEKNKAKKNPNTQDNELRLPATDPNEQDSLTPSLTDKKSFESDESISNLDSALDELQTTSLGLSTDVAAELVSELEDITPQLDAVLDDNLTIEQEAYEVISVGEFDSFEEIMGAEGSNSENELTSEDTMDLLDAAIISHEENSHLAENKPANYIEQKIVEQNDLEQFDNHADSKNREVDNSNVFVANKNEIEEIDFSNLAPPILESAREDDFISIQSEYSLEEEEPESSGEQIALATSKEYQNAHDAKTQEHEDLHKSIDEFDSDLSIEHLDSGTKTVEEILKDQQEEDSIDVEIELERINTDFSLEDDELPVLQGKADFYTEDDDLSGDETEVEGKLPLVNEKLELSDLSLEVENEASFGRADFLKDEEFEMDKKDEEASSSNENPRSSLVASEEKLTELSLEPTEEVITGRAVYIKDDEDLLPVENSNSSLDDALTNAELELENDKSSTGRAHFSIDETDEMVNIDEVVDEEEIVDKQVSLTELNENIKFDINRLTEEKLAVNEQEDSFSLTIEEESSDFLSNNIESNEELSFSIPMLEDTATDIDFYLDTEEPQVNLTPCWIIGASLGGPAAVKRFLQNIPADINASFIVVQHIDENFLPVLADILTNNSHFEVKVASGSSSLKPGSVFLAPLKGKLTFLSDGSMLVDHSQSWSAPYSPCIDDVIESMSAVYTEKCGVIIFSGMGQDGFNGAKKLDALNGEVWAQSVETCANASMPQAVINAGLAKVVATPEMLADRLVKKLSDNE